MHQPRTAEAPPPHHASPRRLLRELRDGVGVAARDGGREARGERPGARGVVARAHGVDEALPLGAGAAAAAAAGGGRGAC